MKLTKKYSLLSVSRTSGKKKVSGVSVFTSIKKVLDCVARKVGSSLSEERLENGVVFYLGNRPKDRQGRLDWNKEVDRVSTLCAERMSSYSPGIIVGRTGNQLEITKRRGNVKK